MSGIKHDRGKPRMDLIPPILLTGVATVLQSGIEDGGYEARNWEKGVRWGRYFGGLMRHLWAWWGGEDCDPKSNYSHLWHAGCCIAFLMHYENQRLRYGEFDDRPVDEKIKENGDIF